MIRDSPPEEVTELPRNEVVTAKFSADESPSEVLVSAIASAEDRDPADIDALYDQYDPDALDALLHSGANESDEEPLKVEFEFAGYFVTMESDGGTTLRDTPGEK